MRRDEHDDTVASVFDAKRSATRGTQRENALGAAIVAVAQLCRTQHMSLGREQRNPHDSRVNASSAE
jgi:hypothetical protein